MAFRRGEENPQARIREQDVMTILFMRGFGYSYRRIARAVLVSKSQCARIALRQCWRHVL